MPTINPIVDERISFVSCLVNQQNSINIFVNTKANKTELRIHSLKANSNKCNSLMSANKQHVASSHNMYH